MLNRILSLLEGCDIAVNQLTPVHGGMGGAYVFSADDKYIVKYSVFSELDTSTIESLKNEYVFYRWSAKRQIDYIPDIFFQTINRDEMIIIMKKYQSLDHKGWNEDLQKRAMQLCARINATNIKNYEYILNIDKVFYDYPLTVSHSNWLKLHDKYPDIIDASILSSMYEKHDEIVLTTERLAVPKTLCHGDFHPYNFLVDGDKLLICDWQGVSVARGIGDVAFFISRGSAMGLDIDKDMLIKEYHEAVCRYTNETIELDDLYKVCASSEFSVAFKFWAEHLQHSSIEQIMGIYDPMVINFKSLM